MYEPQEDSQMLREVVEAFLKKNPKRICADIGTGTGYQGIAMKPYCDLVLCSDINEDAINCTINAIGKNPEFKVFKSDLFKSYKREWEKKIDVIAFNPPYLPKEAEELDDIELTSGDEGVDVTIRFIEESAKFLSEDGCVFFVASSLSNLNKIHAKLKEKKFSFKIALKKHFFFEDILIYEAKHDL